MVESGPMEDGAAAYADPDLYPDPPAGAPGAAEAEGGAHVVDVAAVVAAVRSVLITVADAADGEHPDARLVFERLVDKAGLHGTKELLRKCGVADDEPRAGRLMQLATDRVAKTLLEGLLAQAAAAAPAAELAFGCRHPASLPGSWDRAFVVAKQAGSDTVTAAEFHGGADHVGRPTLDKALADYGAKLRDGWVPMDAADVASTSGVRVGPATLTTCPGLSPFAAEAARAFDAPARAPSPAAAAGGRQGWFVGGPSWWTVAAAALLGLALGAAARRPHAR